MAYHQDMHTDKQILLGSYNILLFIIQYFLVDESWIVK